MSQHKKEWRKSQITREKFNDEIYALLNSALAPYKTDPQHERYNDARLVCREILDNIYKHNDTALIFGLELKINTDHLVEIKIYHDGGHFDPFDNGNECILLKQLNYEYNFQSKFIGTDSGRYRLNLTFDLSVTMGARNDSI